MLTVGEKFSHYKVISAIGAGGMGEVYLAEDSRLNRRIALKILPGGVAADFDRLKRFEQEARSDIFSFGVVLPNSKPKWTKPLSPNFTSKGAS